MSDDFDFEPVPGLPAALPEGETLLWQGSPDWLSVARHVYHAGLVIGYFTVLIAWRLFSAYWTGADMTAATGSALTISVVAAIVMGLIGLLAWLTTRTTIYSITSQRVLMRYGIALSLTVNLPFSRIGSADLALNRDRTGNIALKLIGDGKLGYVHLWPHVRAWYLKDPQPMMRSLPQPASVANLLSKAMLERLPEASRTAIVAADAATAQGATSSAPFGAASA